MDFGTLLGFASTFTLMYAPHEPNTWQADREARQQIEL